MLLARPYELRDRGACLDLLSSNVPEYFLASDREEVADFLDRLEEYGVRYFVFEDGDRVVACGGVGVDAKKDARMCWGMVERSRHRQGLGRLMLFLRLLVGAKMGAKSASLATIPTVAGFFEHEGFALTSFEDDHYAPGMHRRDLALVLDAATVERLRARLDELARGRLLFDDRIERA
jgi:hypothetical protein